MSLMQLPLQVQLCYNSFEAGTAQGKGGGGSPPSPPLFVEKK